jgi:hypothetical protein
MEDLKRQKYRHPPSRRRVLHTRDLGLAGSCAKLMAAVRVPRRAGTIPQAVGDHDCIARFEA